MNAPNNDEEKDAVHAPQFSAHFHKDVFEAALVIQTLYNPDQQQFLLTLIPGNSTTTNGRREFREYCFMGVADVKRKNVHPKCPPLDWKNLTTSNRNGHTIEIQHFEMKKRSTDYLVEVDCGSPVGIFSFSFQSVSFRKKIGQGYAVDDSWQYLEVDSGKRIEFAHPLEKGVPDAPQGDASDRHRMQLSERFRRGILLPLTAEAFFNAQTGTVSPSDKFWHLPLEDHVFLALWVAQVFQSINVSCGVLIDDHEDTELPYSMATKAIQVLDALAKGNRGILPELHQMQRMLEKSKQSGYSVFFVL